MIEQLVIVGLLAALLYAYFQGKKQGRNAQQVSELKEHAESISKGIKAKRAFDADDAERKRVQDRFSE
jgi:lipopolysaccharide export system protein LptC